MRFRSNIVLIVSYLLVIAPGCRQRAASDLSGESRPKPKTSVKFQDSDEYKELQKKNVSQVVDKVFDTAQKEVSEYKLSLMRVAADGSRQIATGGLDEYWQHKYPGYRYYYVDNMQSPSVVFSVKSKLVNNQTVVLELIEHSPKTFEIVSYSPLFIELTNNSRRSVVSNVGQFQRSLNRFSENATQSALEHAESSAEEGTTVSEKAIRQLVYGAVVAVVSAAIGYVIASALKKQTEGKMSWGIVAGAAVVGVAVFLLVLYSTYTEEDEVEVIEPIEPTDEDLKEHTIKAQISDRTWEFITLAR